MHKLNPEFLEETIHVALIGAGGNGSQMLTGLARLHTTLRALGHPGGLQVFVYDPDVVTEHNVGRQLFSPADVGQNKAAVLVNRINAYYGLHWYAVPAEWPRNDNKIHLYITCVDSAQARRYLHDYFRTAGQGTRDAYWLDLGNLSRTGQVILGQPLNAWNKKDPWRLRTVTEIYPELLDPKLPEDTAPSCSLAQALDRQDLFINQHVSTWGLQLLWQLLRRGTLAHHGYAINLEQGQVVPFPVREQKPIEEKEFRGPLRKIKKVIKQRKNVFERNTVKLVCGHITESNGEKSARCPKCKGKPNAGAKPRRKHKSHPAKRPIRRIRRNP